MSRGAGRPTDFTPKTVEKILTGLRNGLTRRAASAQGGITYKTLNQWLKQKSKVIFVSQVEEAEDAAEADFTGVLKKAAFGHEVRIEKTKTNEDGTSVTTVETRWEFDWRAGLEWLKRRRREDWSEQITVEDEIGPRRQALAEETLRRIREDAYGWSEGDTEPGPGVDREP